MCTEQMKLDAAELVHIINFIIQSIKLILFRITPKIHGNYVLEKFLVVTIFNSYISIILNIS